MEEIIETITYSTKYALLDSAAYAELNAAISKAAGFSEGENTERYTTETPELAKINIQVVDEVETFDTTCVMIITGRVQELFPELFINMELIDNYIPVELIN